MRKIFFCFIFLCCCAYLFAGGQTEKNKVPSSPPPTNVPNTESTIVIRALNETNWSFPRAKVSIDGQEIGTVYGSIGENDTVKKTVPDGRHFIEIKNYRKDGKILTDTKSLTVDTNSSVINISFKFKAAYKLDEPMIDNIPVKTAITPPPPQPPEIISFEVSPAVIKSGELATLSWKVSNATSIIIDGQKVMSSDTAVQYESSILVPSVEDRSFTIVVMGADKMPEIKRTVQLKVEYPLPEVELTLNSTSIKKGEKAILSWEILNASKVILKGVDEKDVVDPAYRFMEVNPAVKTTYTIIVTGVGGQKTDEATLEVINPDDKFLFIPDWNLTSPGDEYTGGPYLSPRLSHVKPETSKSARTEFNKAIPSPVQERTTIAHNASNPLALSAQRSIPQTNQTGQRIYRGIDWSNPGAKIVPDGHFSVREVTMLRESGWEGIYHIPNEAEMDNIIKLAAALQNIRDAYGKPMTITNWIKPVSVNPGKLDIAGKIIVQAADAKYTGRDKRDYYAMKANYNAYTGGGVQSLYSNGLSVDISDRDRSLTNFLLKNQQLLERNGLWMEDGKKTDTYVHLDMGTRDESKPYARRRVF